jgi:hypothetical protein
MCIWIDFVNSIKPALMWGRVEASFETLRLCWYISSVCSWNQSTEWTTIMPTTNVLQNFGSHCNDAHMMIVWRSVTGWLIIWRSCWTTFLISDTMFQKLDLFPSAGVWQERILLVWVHQKDLVSVVDLGITAHDRNYLFQTGQTE